MTKRTTDIVAYLSWVGLLIAMIAGDRQNSRFHLNQGLVLAIISVVWGLAYRVVYAVLTIATFGLAGILLGAVNSLFWLLFLGLDIMGLVNAINGQEKPLPLIGGIQLLR